MSIINKESALIGRRFLNNGWVFYVSLLTWVNCTFKLTINETLKFVHAFELFMLAKINSLTILIYNYPSFNVTIKTESSNFTPFKQK